MHSEVHRVMFNLLITLTSLLADTPIRQRRKLLRKGLVTDGQREAMTELVGRGVSVKSACQVVGLSSSTFYRESTDWRAGDGCYLTVVGCR